MSFLKKLFGGGGDGGETPAEVIEYNGYSIVATPQKDGGQFRLCGEITKEIDGEVKTHTLIRADIFPGEDSCKEATVRKAKQVIDEQGDHIF